MIKENKQKTCLVLFEEYDDYYTITRYKRIFKSKPTKRKLIEALQDKSLEISTRIHALDNAVKELLEFGKSGNCENCYLEEQTLY